MKVQKLFLVIFLTCFGIISLQAANWFKRKDEKEAEKKEKVVIETAEKKEDEKAADKKLDEAKKELEEAKKEVEAAKK